VFPLAYREAERLYNDAAKAITEITEEAQREIGATRRL
jgi:hypothetical protein